MEPTIWGLGFPKIGGAFLGSFIKRIIASWGLCWVRLFRETTISECSWRRLQSAETQELRLRT